MRNLLDIKLRIKAVEDTRHITKAMETISIAKMRKANAAYRNNIEFFKKIRATISDIMLHTHSIEHRYLTPRATKRSLFIVVASDKGLAGGYNHNVLQMAHRVISTYDSPGIFTVGQMAREFFEHRGMSVDVEFVYASNHHSMRDAQNIADSLLSLFDADVIDEAHIIFTALESGKPIPTSLQLLPIPRGDIIEDRTEELTHEEVEYYKELVYDPSPEEVLSVLIPQYLVGVIYGALVQASASEHSSRRVAMNNATNNASEIISRLQLSYNRARQAAVTNEISEIITCTMSVKEGADE